MTIFFPGMAGGAGAGSVAAAGAAAQASRGKDYPDREEGGVWDDDGLAVSSSAGRLSRERSREPTRADNGFSYQGKRYDPALNEPMAVSAETHGDFWEDDMDYTESVS